MSLTIDPAGYAAWVVLVASEREKFTEETEVSAGGVSLAYVVLYSFVGTSLFRSLCFAIRVLMMFTSGSGAIFLASGLKLAGCDGALAY